MAFAVDEGDLGTGLAGGHDAADLGDADARNGTWEFYGWRRGEEKLVVFAAVQSGLEGAVGREALRDGMDGEMGSVDFGGYL
jgi:hypothetical protein